MNEERTVWVVCYDAYGDFWVDTVYDNEEAAKEHAKRGPYDIYDVSLRSHYVSLFERG